MEKVTNQKPSLQLEGYPIYSEINENVYSDLLSSSSKYIIHDTNNRNITVKRSFFKNNKKTQNVTRYYAEILAEEISIQSPLEKHPSLLSSSFTDDLIDQSFKGKTIAIILESPHIDEYETNIDKLTPIAPAQGTIGKKIETIIKELLLLMKEMSIVDENSFYRIVIINTVPFQTSLHFIHGKQLNNHYRELRDKVWMKMWSEIPYIKEEFHQLFNTFKKGSIIINASTKSLKPFINHELVQYSTKFTLFEGNHPSATNEWIKSLFRLN